MKRASYTATQAIERVHELEAVIARVKAWCERQYDHDETIQVGVAVEGVRDALGEECET